MSSKDNQEPKTTKVKAAKTSQPEAKSGFIRGIIGTALLLVFGSIAFMVVVIWTGTDNWTYKALTAPAALFDLVIAFVAFSKILK